MVVINVNPASEGICLSRNLYAEIPLQVEPMGKVTRVWQSERRLEVT
jgi:hypothetical protein